MSCPENVHTYLAHKRCEISASPKEIAKENGRGEVGASSEMSCTFKAKPLPEIKWLRFGNPIEEDQTKYEITTENRSEVELRSLLKILK